MALVTPGTPGYSAADVALGLDRPISRRDFLNGVALGVGAAATGVARAGEEAAPRLKDWLLYERRIEAQVLAIRGRLHVRLAAQVYNDERDFEALAESIDAWPV